MMVVPGASRSWKGHTEDPVADFFALSQCTCATLGENGTPCPAWTCVSQRLDYMHIDYGWALGEPAASALQSRTQSSGPPIINLIMSLPVSVVLLTKAPKYLPKLSSLRQVSSHLFVSFLCNDPRQAAAWCCLSLLHWASSWSVSSRPYSSTKSSAPLRWAIPNQDDATGTRAQPC
jgi:hypothetical protein